MENLKPTLLFFRCLFVMFRYKCLSMSLVILSLLASVMYTKFDTLNAVAYVVMHDLTIFLPCFSKRMVRIARGDISFIIASEPLPSKPYILVSQPGGD